MITSSTIVVHINPFCKCEGHIKEMKMALGKLDDVKFLSMDLENGKYTILTTHHPEAIKYALKNAFPKKDINVSQELGHSYSQPLCMPNVNDIASALVTMSQAKGIESVEYTQSNTFRLTIANRYNQPSLVYYLHSTVFEVLMLFTLKMLHH